MSDSLRSSKLLACGVTNSIRANTSQKCVELKSRRAKCEKGKVSDHAKIGWGAS